MASKAPSHGCHGEPGTAAVPEQGVKKKQKTSGWLSAGVTVPTAAHQQTMTQPPGATWSKLMMRGIGYI